LKTTKFDVVIKLSFII